MEWWSIAISSTIARLRLSGHSVGRESSGSIERGPKRSVHWSRKWSGWVVEALGLWSGLVVESLGLWSWLVVKSLGLYIALGMCGANGGGGGGSVVGTTVRKMIIHCADVALLPFCAAKVWRVLPETLSTFDRLDGFDICGGLCEGGAKCFPYFLLSNLELLLLH